MAGPSFSLAPRGSQVIDLARLDVDDVTLTDEPAGTKVEGSWVLSQNGKAILSARTKHGAYLPHGRYHLVITYQSPRGTPQKLEQDVDL